VQHDLHAHRAMGLLTIFLNFTKEKYSCLNRDVLKLRQDDYFEPATPLNVVDTGGGGGGGGGGGNCPSPIKSWNDS
jgi:hypothetical protein